MECSALGRLSGSHCKQLSSVSGNGKRRTMPRLQVEDERVVMQTVSGQLVLGLPRQIRVIAP